MIFENIEIVKEAFKKYWQLENERPLVSVNAYKDKKGYWEYMEFVKNDKRYKDPFHLKVDPEIKINHQLEIFRHKYFAGETLPILTTAIGPGIGSAFLGSIVDLRGIDEPTWFHENINDLENYQVKFDEWNIWWNIQKLIVECSAKAAREHGILSEIPVDIFHGIDTLMLLRGSEKLATDLIIYPDKIKSVNAEILKLWKYWVTELLKIQEPYFEGNSTAWLNLWGPGKTFCLQSDYMTMISTEMYEEFILEDVKFMCNQLDHVMFHFDGPDEVVRHLDFLLQIPNLHGIQWNPETNCENIRHLPTLKKIQEAGKCLILNIAANEIETLVKELSPRGLLLNVDPFDEPYDTPEEADEIVRKVKSL
ncbi:MAG: hypothetical protein ACOC10_12155 [Bacteroidota bacterium]